jgi:hypothetical protein
MMPVGRFVAALSCGSHRGVCEIRRLFIRNYCTYGNPMSRVKKLTGFQKHFDHVFVTMPTGASAHIGMEKEDVHSLEGGGRSGGRMLGTRISSQERPSHSIFT